MIVACIHGRTANTREAVECLDCEELAALRLLEGLARDDKCHTSWDNPDVFPTPALRTVLGALDDIRRRKGIGALGHPETRHDPA